MIRLLFLTFVVVFFFGGCSSKKRVVVEKKELPAWYLSPPISNEKYLYGVGEGESKEHAIANALSNMAGSLSISISSDFQSKSFVRDGTITSMQTDTVSLTNAQVHKLRISDYQLIHVDEFAFQRVLVLVKTDKKKLFDSLLKDIDQNLLDIQRKYETSTNSNILKRIIVANEAKNIVEDMKNSLVALGSLQPKFDTQKYHTKISSIESRHDELLGLVSFSVDSNKDAKSFVAVMKSALSEENYKIESFADKQNQFHLFIESGTTYAKSYGFHIARTALTITTKDNYGVTLGSTKHNLVGQSTQGFEVAKENVAMKFQKKIKKDGLDLILGMEL